MQMRKSTLIALAAALLLWSCSGNDDQEKEKGKIEAMTEQAGQQAAQAIKAPLEKAEAVADAEEQRVKEMAEQQQ